MTSTLRGSTMCNSSVQADMSMITRRSGTAAYRLHRLSIHICIYGLM